MKLKLMLKALVVLILLDLLGLGAVIVDKRLKLEKTPQLAVTNIATHNLVLNGLFDEVTDLKSVPREEAKIVASDWGRGGQNWADHYSTIVKPGGEPKWNPDYDSDANGNYLYLYSPANIPDGYLRYEQGFYLPPGNYSFSVKSKVLLDEGRGVSAVVDDPSNQPAAELTFLKQNTPAWETKNTDFTVNESGWYYLRLFANDGSQAYFDEVALKEFGSEENKVVNSGFETVEDIKNTYIDLIAPNWSSGWFDWGDNYSTIIKVEGNPDYNPAHDPDCNPDDFECNPYNTGNYLFIYSPAYISDSDRWLRYEQVVYLPPGDYSFSVKSKVLLDEGRGVFGLVACGETDGCGDKAPEMNRTVANSQLVYDEADWISKVIVFTINTSGNYIVRLFANDGSQAYFDDVKLEPKEVMNFITVCPEGTPGQDGCDYIGGDGIQQAVDLAGATSPDLPRTILIKEGEYTRQTYTEYQTPVGSFKKCFVDTKEKYLIFEGENNPIWNGAGSVKMGGVCAKGGEIGINGLTITNFKADDDSCTGTCSTGRGVQLELSIKADINNSTISGNGGTGVDLWNSSTAAINNSTISGNEEHGVALADSSTAAINNSTISGNEEYGVVLWDSSTAAINNSTISGNGGHGVALWGSSTADINNSTISGNEWYGVALLNSSTAAINNSTISENEGYGVALADSSTVALFNNLVYQNGYSGINISTGQGTVVNNLVVDNAAVGITAVSKDNFIRMEYNLSYGNQYNWNDWWGDLLPDGNISVDPLFVNTGNGDFHLQENSPAIDAGDPDIFDVDGSRSDMGIYGGPGGNY